MKKNRRVQMNLRLMPEVAEKIGKCADAWEVTRGEVVEIAMAGLNPVESRVFLDPEPALDETESSRDRAIRLAQEAKRRLEDAREKEEATEQTLRDGESLALCVHCDEQFTLARGVKGGSLCPGCMRKGHRNMVPCRGCEQDIELARRRAADPGAAERTDIDYADSQV